MEEKKTTSIKINPEIWKKFRILCINKNIDLADYLENLINKELEINCQI